MTITRAMVEDAAYDAGGEFRTDYSGRGMFGDTCVAIVCEFNSKHEIASVIARQQCEEEFGYDEFDEDDFDDALEDVKERISSDSLGRSIIYYFRGVK